jgi:hypothetical protein
MIPRRNLRLAAFFLVLLLIWLTYTRGIGVAFLWIALMVVLFAIFLWRARSRRP